MTLNIPRADPTGLSIVVVGGGIAGLSFAIEAFRKGHNVRVIERRPSLDPYGDIVVLQVSALHTPKKWPGFMDRVRPVAFTPISHMKKWDGTFIGDMPLGTQDDDALPISRATFNKILYEYALQLGITIEFGMNAVDYFETGHSGTVVIANGQAIEADLVVAADGVGSKAWKLVTGHKDQPISSGFALFRTSFPAAAAMQNPVIAKEFEGHRSYLGLYFGPNVHSVFGKHEDEMFWTLTHRDDGTAQEDWTKPATIEKALPYVKGWAPFLSELIKATPNGICTDFKLMWRNPQPKMVSPQARVVQIGDSAHAFLPTSGSGATMAMEDSYTLATCLAIGCGQAGGKSNVPLALRVFNLIRFERVACAQKVGFQNREALHKTDWDELQKTPGKGFSLLRNWMQFHDPEEYAIKNYEAAARHLLEGTPFTNTNSPPGYTYKPWTIQELLGASDRGEKIVEEGDWS